jgi:hypothetical protein
VEIPSLQVTQHFADKVNQVLDLAGSSPLPPLDDDYCTSHIACSRYVKLQVFMGFWGNQSEWGSQVPLKVLESLLFFIGPLELVLFFK